MVYSQYFFPDVCPRPASVDFQLLGAFFVPVRLPFDSTISVAVLVGSHSGNPTVELMAPKGDGKTTGMLATPLRWSIYGSPGRARTYDTVLNRHPLCQLSYRGIAVGPGWTRTPISTLKRRDSAKLSYGPIGTVWTLVAGIGQSPAPYHGALWVQ